MVVVGALILPHGAMIFDGNPSATTTASTPTARRVAAMPDQLRQDCGTLFSSCCKAVEIAAAASPDVIFLNTPHGICLTNAFGVYANTKAKGTAEWNEQWSEFGVEATLDTDLTARFLEHLQKEKIPAESIVSFTKGVHGPLRWGEVVPLWFLQDKFLKKGTKIVIFSNPTKRTKAETFSMGDTARAGHSIAAFLRGLSERVLYVVSGDLSHCHKTDCPLPLYLPDPSFQNLPKNPTALPFDLCIEKWVKGDGPLATEELEQVAIRSIRESVHSGWDAAVGKQWLAKAYELHGSALACGIYGFGVLHGLLEAEVQENVELVTHFLCRLAPTYYGMLVAVFDFVRN